MRIISPKKLREFYSQPEGKDAEQPLRVWQKLVEHARWRKWAELRSLFPSADQVGDCVVFNIHGNAFRLIARVRFTTQIVYVLKVMTHAQYDRVDWAQERGCHKPPPKRPKRMPKKKLKRKTAKKAVKKGGKKRTRKRDR